ncbi:MAG: hypothetical protein AB7U75_11070 [Hyphomicrobiaceae bacterium]
MNAASSDVTGRRPPQRLIDRLFERFETRHHAVANRLIQFVAIPVLMWSGFALAKTLPEPALLAVIPGVDWAVAAGAAISLGYAILSWRLGVAMAVASLVLIAVAAYYAGNESLPLWQPALVFLVLSAVLWLVGRRIEGRPRLLGEMALDLLIGPAWLLARVLRLLRIGY